MRKAILVVFSPRLKVWCTHEKACPRKISTAEVHINSSKYQTVCELLTPCRFIHAFTFKRKRDRDLNIISAGSGLTSWWGGNASGQVQSRRSAWYSWNPTDLPAPPHGAERGCLGGAVSPSFLVAPGKSHAESNAKRPSRVGRRLWEDKGPWESGIVFNILGTRPCKMFIYQNNTGAMAILASDCYYSLKPYLLVGAFHNLVVLFWHCLHWNHYLEFV